MSVSSVLISSWILATRDTVQRVFSEKNQIDWRCARTNSRGNSWNQTCFVQQDSWIANMLCHCLFRGKESTPWSTADISPACPPHKKNSSTNTWRLQDSCQQRRTSGRAKLIIFSSSSTTALHKNKILLSFSRLIPPPQCLPHVERLFITCILATVKSAGSV